MITEITDLSSMVSAHLDMWKIWKEYKLKQINDPDYYDYEVENMMSDFDDMLKQCEDKYSEIWFAQIELDSMVDQEFHDLIGMPHYEITLDDINRLDEIINKWANYH